MREPDSSERRIIEEELRLAEMARLLPGAIPYFAHMRLESDGRERDILVGLQSRVADGLTLVHWQNAPLAGILFSTEPGEAYEVAIGPRALTGTLAARNLTTFRDAGLVAITTPNARLVRETADRWRAEPLPRPVLAGLGRGLEADPSEVQLDSAQRRAVMMPGGRPMLVLGEAGCGKTTVALHRLAFLSRQTDRLRAAVIVPTEGLRRLCRTLVDRLRLPGVEVWLYDRWAAAQAQRAFPDLPRRESRDQAAGVIRFKRHGAVQLALARLAEKSPDRRTARRDLHHLFGDSALLEPVLSASAGALTPGMMAAVLEHTRVQFSKTTEQTYAHVNADRLQALDGRSLDDGTPNQDALSVDVEDYAVLFELERLRAERAGRRPIRPLRYDCLVLDEAQELAPLELKLIGRAVAPGGTLIVAGDSGQQVDPSAYFTDWAASMADLGAREHEQVWLETSYRCPEAVTDLARWLLPRAERPAVSPPKPAGEGSVLKLHFDHECHQIVSLIDALRDLQNRSPAASAAVICRSATTARRLAELLGRGVGLKLGLDGDFDFKTSLHVTTVAEVKGLEFDHVILPDAGPSAYPDEPRERRALYVAVTRAALQLVLATTGELTPLLPASL